MRVHGRISFWCIRQLKENVIKRPQPRTKFESKLFLLIPERARSNWQINATQITFILRAYKAQKYPPDMFVQSLVHSKKITNIYLKVPIMVTESYTLAVTTKSEHSEYEWWYMAEFPSDVFDN